VSLPTVGLITVFLFSSGFNLEAQGILFKCPDLGQNTGVRAHPRFGGIWTNDVKSWEGCSALCQKRSDYNYWTWHHGYSGAWAYKCVTMIDAGGKSYDINAVSGERSCKRDTQHDGIFDCPDLNQNTGVRAHPRVGAQWTNDVKSWEGCSDMCQKRSDCNYWTWHHGNSGSWAHKCVTMTDAGGKSYDANAVSGERSCRRDASINGVKNGRTCKEKDQLCAPSWLRNPCCKGLQCKPHPHHPLKSYMIVHTIYSCQ